MQDCGDASASNSNSSVAPSSASSSPSRTSSKLGRTKQRKGVAGQDVLLQRHSRTSSGDSSPSLHTSDFPDYSDDEVEIETGYDTKGRTTQAAPIQGNPFRRAEKAMDHAFWKSRYANVGGTTPTLDRETALSGSKSVPGTANTLHYVRKPGPINVTANLTTSRLVTALSPYNKSSHKRYGSEYGYSSQIRRVDSKNGVKTSDAIPRQGSAESATSSTPRSKAGMVLSSSVTRLQTTASESTLSTSASRPAPSTTAGTMRHVSDTVVHTIRRAIVPFTAFEQSADAPPPAHRASLHNESMALAALKDVARSHGMIDGPLARKVQTSQHHPQKSGMSSLDHRVSSTLASDSSTSPVQSYTESDLQNSHSSHGSEGGQGADEPQEKGGRGRSRKRQSISRSPSPPSWASWAEDEPITHRRGRSARRGQ